MSARFKSCLSWIVAALSLFCIASYAANSTIATGKKARTAFTLIETVPLNGTTATFSLSSGKVGQTGNGFQIQPDNNASSNVASTIVSVPVMPYTNGTKTKAEIEAQATTFFLPYATGVGNSLKAWMTANNYKASTFIYEHEVGVAGYSCSVGTVSGSQCVTTSTTPATPVYSCPSGAELSGTTCITTTSTEATPSYTCQAGQTLSGSTCTQTSSSSSAATVTYSCPSGQTLSGTSCLTSTVTTSAATAIYSCPSGGSLSGSTCVTSSSYAGTPIYSCPNGGELSGSSCVTTTSSSSSWAVSGTAYSAYDVYDENGAYAYTDVWMNHGIAYTACADNALLINGKLRICGYFWVGTNYYYGVDITTGIGYWGHEWYGSYQTPVSTNIVATRTCPLGSTLSGTNCISSTTTAATVSSYTCPSGGSLSGSTCTTTSTTSATVSYTCSAGLTLSGSICSQTTTSTTSATPSYSCPSGQTLSGTNCILTTTSSSSATIASYSCPSGTTLSGSSCLTSTSAPASISSYSCSNGVVSGTTCVISVYSAAIPSGATRSMKLTWQVSVMDSGRIMYGDPRVIDADPTYVYVTYTSKLVASGLPSTWTYTDAGILKWQLRRRDGTPVTSWTSVDTGGVYDEPTASGSNPNFGLNCLANKASDPACPQTVVDVNTLIAMSSSASAIIDYVRQIEPLYDSSTDAATGDPIRVARIAISVDSRTLTPTDCTNETYRNTGQYGFALATTLDRYTFYPSSYPVLVNRYTNTSMSPTQSYDYTTTTSLTSSELQTQVINPFNASGPLVSTSTIAYLTYLAPISVIDTSSPLEITGYSGEGLASKSGTWNGRIFTIDAFSGQRDQDQGYFRTSAITLNVPLCQIEYAKVTINRADDQSLIAVNNQPVSMSESWRFGLSDSTSNDLGSFGPFTKSSASRLTSAFTGPVVYSSYFWGPTATTNIMTYQDVCTTYSAPVEYCDGDGCYSYTPCLTYVTKQAGYAYAIWSLSGGVWDDLSLPIDFTSKLINGTNQILLQHGVIGLGGQTIRLEFKLKDY